jgi:outer membrane protein OmpA-like peptidoglycan-associated protein
VAGGNYLDGSGNFQAFVSVYNGSTWVDHEVGAALDAGNYAYVTSVSCTSSTSCVAGGRYQDGSNNLQAFVSVYSGSTWVDHEVVASLNVGNNAYVSSVSCTSSTSCVAGGNYLDGSGNFQAFVSVYNGSTWVDHEVAASLNDGNSAYVSSVSCTSSTSCVAGGSYQDGSGNNQAFVSVYNGSTWVDHEVGAALNAGNFAYVRSVSCTSSGLCAAGGVYTDGSNHGQAFLSSTTVPVAHARVSGTVYFASGSSTLSMSAKHTLNTIASQIVSQSQSSVTLNGYTDPVGSTAYSVRLSTQRANSVKSYLQAKLTSLGDTHVTFVLHGRGVTRSGSSFAKDRKVTLS